MNRMEKLGIAIMAIACVMVIFGVGVFGTKEQEATRPRIQVTDSKAYVEAELSQWKQEVVRRVQDCYRIPAAIEPTVASRDTVLRADGGVSIITNYKPR